MIEVSQTVDLPKEVDAGKGADGAIVLRVSGRLGLFALNRSVELLQEAAAELEAAL